MFYSRMELAGETSNREQPAQLEYLGSKMHPTALSPSAASQTDSYRYRSMSFGLGFSNARKLSAPAGLRHRRKVIPMHKSLKMSPLLCSQVMFLGLLSLLISELVIKQHEKYLLVLHCI